MQEEDAWEEEEEMETMNGTRLSTAGFGTADEFFVARNGLRSRICSLSIENFGASDSLAKSTFLTRPIHFAPLHHLACAEAHGAWVAEG